MDFKLSEEVAQEQLNLLLEFYAIEVADVQDLQAYYAEDDAVQKAIRGSCDRLKRFIRMGLLEITDENGLTVIQRLRCPVGEMSAVSYRIIDGMAKQEMRHARENDFYGKIYYLMGALSKTPANVIAKFRAVDSSVVECLGAVFLTA